MILNKGDFYFHSASCVLSPVFRKALSGKVWEKSDAFHPIPGLIKGSYINTQCWVDYFIKCNALQVADYMMKIVVINVINLLDYTF